MDDKFLIMYKQDVFGRVLETNSGARYELKCNKSVNRDKIDLEPVINSCCDTSKCMEYDLLIIVKSFVLNFGRRDVIRRTWGKHTSNMRTLFVVAEYSKNDPLLQTEHRTYEDIIVLNLEDRYENLVYKTIYSMEWLVQKNIKARFFHFIDDDRILNVDNLLRVAYKDLKQSDSKIIGHKIPWSRPRRKPKKGKNVLSFEEYPYLWYPPYIIGGTFLTNFRTLELIVKGFSYIKPFNVEDCYIGIVSYVLSITLVHDSGFLPQYAPVETFNKMISAPGYDQTYKNVIAWEILRDKNLSRLPGV